MDVGVQFEHWQRQPEFSLAIFRLRRFGCAKSSDLITRKLITKSFASWSVAEPFQRRNSERCSNLGSVALPLARTARPRSSLLTCKVYTNACWLIAARVRSRWPSSVRLQTTLFLPTLAHAAERWRERRNIRSVTSCSVSPAAHSAVSG